MKMVPPIMASPADDRILPETRVVAALIVPFLVVAFVLLYLLPEETGRLFAWEIRPPMTALLMGAGYIAGAYFFTRVVFAKRWHQVALGFPPVATFAALLMTATVLHWELFNHGHISFFTWVALYATTPFIVFALWLRNRATDPGLPDAEDAVLSPSVRAIMVGVGALILLIGLLLYAWPALFIPIWPWPLTEAAGRTLGAWFVLPGVFGVSAAHERRWSAFRIPFQSQLIGILLILAGALRARQDFDFGNPLAWLFIAGMAALAGGIMLLTLWMARMGKHSTLVDA